MAMPIVQISLLEGRGEGEKERLIAEVTNALVSTIGARRDAVRVLLTEIPAAHWGAGGVSKARKSEDSGILP